MFGEYFSSCTVNCPMGQMLILGMGFNWLI
jgi:hypothetical protein